VAFRAYRADGYGNRLDEVTASTTFAMAPEGSCDAATCAARAPGPHTVTGSTDAGSLTAEANLLVLGTQIVGLRLNPYAAQIRPEQDATFEAVGLDSSGRAVADLTEQTTFSITGDGTCPDGRNTCTATSPGTYRVTGSASISAGTGAGSVTTTPTGEASLVVGSGAAPPDGRGKAASFELSPRAARAYTGFAVTYVATAFDAGGGRLRDVTSSITFTISPDGRCARSSCVADTPGPHTVTGTYTGLTTVVSRASARGLLTTAEPPPGTTATASLTVMAGLSCTGMTAADARDLTASATTGSSDATSVRVQGTFSRAFASCPVVVLVDGKPLDASTIHDDGTVSTTGTVPSEPPRSGSVAVVTVDGRTLRLAAFSIPAPPGLGWARWLLVGALVLIGGAATAARIRRQRRWVSEHVGVEPIPDAGTLSTRQEDPATRSHSVHLATHTDEGSTTITEEEE
jgi:hypothetical protein